MTIKVAINGLGRIGRLFLRASLEAAQLPYEVVAVNDLAPAATLKHLLQFDSTHGPFTDDLQLEEHSGNFLLSHSRGSITVLQNEDPRLCPWGDLGVDLVIEATGSMRTRALLEAHLQAGAQQVLLTSPCFDSVDFDVVYGINHELLSADHHLISNQSCTTNALAVICQPLNSEFGIVKGMLTEIHSYTNDQRLLDSAHADLRRGRAAAQSMIPTATAGAEVLAKVLPELSGKIQGYSMRVPTLNVAAIDLTLELNRATTVEDINEFFIQQAQTAFRPVLAVNDLPLVSSDFIHHRASAVIDLTQTQINDGWIKLLAWYDNEWGYVSRLVDVASHLAGVKAR